MTGDPAQRSIAHQGLTLSALAFVGLSLVFTYAPGIDLWVSGLYAAPEGGFPAENRLALEIPREVVWNLMLAFLALSLVMLAGQRLIGPARRIGPRVWAFIALSYTLGPGLLANGILKAHWGRARPRTVEEFGGTAQFSPALEVSDGCASNCSFVSGEASGAMATALLLGLLFLPGLGSLGRRILGALLVLIAAIGSGLRIVKGAHFLSDILFAWALMGVVVFALYLILRIDRELLAVTPANMWRDVRALIAGLRMWLLRPFKS